MLLFFLSPTCPVCKTLLPVLKSIGSSERKWLDILLSSDGARTDQDAIDREHGLGGFPTLRSTELGLAYRVAKLPYAVLIDSAGVIRSAGLVNTREHLESLFEASERGVASIQDYVRRTRQGEVA
jgi:methylamine dehydrogenase accessory protein MauD